MRLYAQPSDLTPVWVDTEPANASRLIRDASGLVEDAALMARYNTDDDGYPTDPTVREAFRNAVCKQVAIWHAGNLDPDKGSTGQTPHLTGESAGSGSVSYSGAASTQELGIAATTLADGALAILRRAGLMKPEVVYLR